MTSIEFTRAVRALHANGMSCTEISRDHNVPLDAVRDAITPQRDETPLFITPDLDGLYGTTSDDKPVNKPRQPRHGKANTRNRRRA